MANKSTLANVLQAIVATGNREQNMGYPAGVFSTHFNIATSFLLTALSDIYPDKQDALLPFIKQAKIAVSGGFFKLPDDYRNMLGAPSINVKPDGTDCGEASIIDTEAEFKVSNQKAGCKTRPITIVSKKDFDYLTTSEYAYPTLDNPIGYFAGDNKIKVCPYDISKVELTYVRQEKVVVYGYVMQPDDTYISDTATTIESEWNDAGFQYLYKAVLSLYGAYQKDQNIQNWSAILNQQGIF